MLNKNFSQRDAVAFINDAVDVASRAADDGRPADVAKALITIADVALAGATTGAASVTFAEIERIASSEVVDLVAQPPRRDAIADAITRGRASLGLGADDKGSDV